MTTLANVMCGCGYPMDSGECLQWHADNPWSVKRAAQPLDFDAIMARGAEQAVADDWKADVLRRADGED